MSEMLNKLLVTRGCNLQRSLMARKLKDKDSKLAYVIQYLGILVLDVVSSWTCSERYWPWSYIRSWTFIASLLFFRFLLGLLCVRGVVIVFVLVLQKRPRIWLLLLMTMNESMTVVLSALFMCTVSSGKSWNESSKSIWTCDRIRLLSGRWKQFRDSRRQYNNLVLCLPQTRLVASRVY